VIEEQGLKSALGSSLQDPILKEPITERADCRVAQGVGPEFKPQYQTQNQKTPQDFTLAKLVLYHLSYTSSPFCSGYFGDGVS
jgi:hypothetical protein